MTGFVGKKILIVDDSENVRHELESLYTALGLQVVGMAADGSQALEKIESLVPDIVSMDIIMPEMDGIECFLQLQKSGTAAPKVLFVTALAAEQRVIMQFAEIIDPSLYLSKPPSESSLKEKLNEFFPQADV